ncbi:MAG: tetratricopeptide repeat protein, partial [Bacteroidota bacterium]|nr:tetratricopeptide repeat protein [Bacteroidota bacterium]
FKKQEEKGSNEKNKQLFDTHLFNGLKAKSLEDYDEALKYFGKCIKLDDKNPTPFYESAIINTANGSYAIAIEQIKTAERLAPTNRWYLLLYAEILFNKQDFVNAAIQYKKLITLEPGNEELYFKLSDVYIYSNNFKKAIGVYDDLEAHKGVDKTLSMQKHKLYRELNDIEGAINELSAILNVFPDDIEALEILAELYLLNDEKDKAFELFKGLAIIAPNNGRIHLTLADYYREIGDNEKSYKELKLAFKSTKLNIDVKVRILASYYQLIALNEDMAAQAYELAEILIEAHPEDLKARAVFADILYADNQYQEAKEQYLIILEKDKSKREIWGQVLFIQAEDSDFEGMLKTSKEALEYFPADPLFYYFNGASNKWAENYDEAINSLKTGVEFVIDNQNLLLEFHSSLADAYHTVKQHKLSDEHYERALEIDPNNVLVLNNYAYYLSVRKTNLEYAKEMSLKCNELEPDNGTYQDTYAWVLYKLKEYELAKEWLLKALLNGSDKSAVVVEHYGDILYKLGEVDEALAQWKKAKKLGGDSDFLIQKIEEGKLYE